MDAFPSATKGRRRRTQSGFSLVEVLIAFSIVSLSIAVILPIFGDNLRTGEAVKYRSMARLHLQSLLDEIGATKPLAPGDEAGDFGDGFSWAVSIAPYAAAPARGPVAAYEVRASVSWERYGSEQALTISTLRLGPAAVP